MPILNVTKFTESPQTMNAIQPERETASEEIAKPTLTALELEGLEIKGLDIKNLEEIGSLNVELLAINKSDRWSIYRRLQELEISCHCEIEKPLKVRIGTPTAALQLWCIARRYRTSRHQQLDFLEDCWQAQSYT